jgi:hypothetical protein
MKKLIYLLIAVLAFSCTSGKYEEETVKCAVTEVTYFSPGKINTLQIDPVWEIKTECNIKMRTRREMNVGDTLVIIRLKPLQ